MNRNQPSRTRIPYGILWRPCCLLWAVLPLQGQNRSENIRLNQVGFYPEAPKIAVVTGPGSTFHLTKPGQTKPVFTGTLGSPRTVAFSQKTVRIADFSAFRTVGTFVVSVPGAGHSHPFDIRPRVHLDVVKAATKGFYYQRGSTPLPATYAGPWARPAGHPDTRVEVHASAATARRPAGTVLASPRGWYDAGDYNKYIVNSGITMGTLLSAYEDFPAFFDTLRLAIPESGDPVPDLLDEARWNLRWMLTMQDPDDGGVYHKLTNAKFDGMVMPDQARATRYVVQKSTAATLDFAAVMAQASRVYRKYPRQLPGLSDSCLSAAIRAWEWAVRNPAVIYDQKVLNDQFEPDVVTGAYGDGDVSDEWTWAAAELYVTTRKEAYYRAIPRLADGKMPLPSWAQVRLLGYYSLARFEKDLTPVATPALDSLKKRLVDFADELSDGASDRAYATVMGKSAGDYAWGSSAVAANQGIVLLQAYRLTGQEKYIRYALANLDYLLGRNATGYSFVTGHGDKTPRHPHHRPSEADGIPEPVPGLLAGGPNANAARQDRVTTYPSAFADEVYTDDARSYASNEIAINWNAPLVYLAAALEAWQFEAGYSVTSK
ncbi:MAG: glycoside hydrolase family 9 protein [Ferruginibacter sp.]|nr:glycoside hydrolase family 9 protein [Cytophagales bacterium]